MTAHLPIVVNTRDEGADGALARAIEDAGMKSVACPMVTIAPPLDPRPFEDAVEHLGEFDWLAFTSAHAIAAVTQHPKWQTAIARGSPPRVAVVGDASARRLESHGVAAHVVPDGVGAAALAAAIVQCVGGVDGVRVLWPRGDRAPSAFGEDLEKAGILVTAPIAYRTLPPADASVAALRATLESNQTAAIAFCSPSSAQNLAHSLGLVDLATVRGRVQVVASIGPTTSAALSALGLEPDVQAESPSMASLANAIAARLGVAAGGAV